MYGVGVGVGEVYLLCNWRALAVGWVDIALRRGRGQMLLCAG